MHQRRRSPLFPANPILLLLLSSSTTTGIIIISLKHVLQAKYRQQQSRSHYTLVSFSSFAIRAYKYIPQDHSNWVGALLRNAKRGEECSASNRSRVVDNFTYLRPHEMEKKKQRDRRTVQRNPIRNCSKTHLKDRSSHSNHQQEKRLNLFLLVWSFGWMVCN